MNYPVPTCPLCNIQDHDTTHLFNCTTLPTTLSVGDLWTQSVEAARLVERWEERLVGHIMAPH